MVKDKKQLTLIKEIVDNKTFIYLNDVTICSYKSLDYDYVIDDIYLVNNCLYVTSKIYKMNGRFLDCRIIRNKYLIDKKLLKSIGIPTIVNIKMNTRNQYEEIIDKMMLDNLGIDESEISGLGKEHKRGVILNLLSQGNPESINMIKGIIDEVENNYSDKETHVENMVNMLVDYVNVSDVEKKKHGEVMTPQSLVKDMLDKLPEHVWSNPDLKWLDPCNGVGIFPVVIVQRLMRGLKDWEPDTEKRYRHIMENMLYVCELQPKNMFLYLCGFDPKDEYNLNVYTGSFLDEGFDEHMKNVWGVDKFDVSVGNPPYNQTIDLKFLNKSHNISDKILFVHPSTWLIDEKNKQKKFLKAKELTKNSLKYVKMFNGNGVFGIYLFVPCVVTYFDVLNGNDGEIKLIDDINDEVVIYDDIMDINKYNTEEYRQIKGKLLEVRQTINLHLDDEPKKYWVNLAQIRGNVNLNGGDMLKDDFYTLVTKHKKVEDSGHGKKNEFSFNTKSEADNFLNYVKTRFVRFCLSIYKNNGNCHRGELNLIPWLDFTQEWDDEKLYKHFKLTQEEIDFIEKVMPEYY